MKKVVTLFIPSFLGLAVFAVLTGLIAMVYPQITWLKDTYWLVHLVLPLCVMGGALALHLTAKGRAAMYLVAYLLNAIGAGCLVGAIYGLRNYLPTAALLPGLFPAVVLCAAACLIPLLPRDFWKDLVSLVLLVLAIGLVIVGIVVWASRSMPFGCAFLFSGLFVLPFPRSVFHADEEWSDRFRHLSRSGFGAFTLVSIVAAFILSDGEMIDGLDGVDLGDLVGSNKKKG